MTSRNLKNFEFRLGRQGIVLFIAGMCFLLLLDFIFGVMVGLHIDAYPEKIARLPDVIRKKLLPAASIVPANESLAVSAPKIEGAKSVAEENDRKPLQEEVVLSSDAALADTKAAGTFAATASVPEMKEGEEKPEADFETIQTPSTGTPGKYLVQVGSFKSRERANEVCKRIVPLGYNPQIIMQEIPQKGRWFRVVIKGFNTKDHAKEAVAALSEKIGWVNCLIRSVK